MLLYLNPSRKPWYPESRMPRERECLPIYDTQSLVDEVLNKTAEAKHG